MGCFYTTALKEYLNVDVFFQKGGGIRADIDEGEITALEVYNMGPINNGSAIFTMTVNELEDFLVETGAGLHVSGISLQRAEQGITIYEHGNVLPGDKALTIGKRLYTGGL